MNTIMKKIGLFLIGAAVALTSCDSILNNSPETEFTKDNFFTSATNVELFANYFYNEFYMYEGAASTNGVSQGNDNFYFNFLNDNQASTGCEKWIYTNVPGTSTNWSTPYVEIRRANTIIEQVPNIESMNDAEKNNWIGVARMWRAWYHYKLVRCFGDCYYVDHVTKTDDEAILYGARQDRSAVMDKVLEDIDFAVENIATEKSTSAWSKDLARAMKSDICLYEAGYSKYTLKNESRATKFYGEVKKACEAIFANGYEFAGYQENYNSLDLSGNKEMIFFKKYLYGQVAHSLIDYCCGSTQTHGMSKDAFDAYLGKDGKVITGNDHGVAIDLTAASGYAMTDHKAINIAQCIAARDPRLAACVDSVLFFPGCGFIRMGAGVYGAAEATSSTGYGVCLFDNVATITDNTKRQAINGNDTDAPIYWLALLKLNYAEACAETGDDAAAKAAVNEIRAAHAPGMGTIETTIASSGKTVLDEVRRERRVELMYAKNDRYWSLVRWNELEKLDTQKHPDVNRGAYVKDIAAEIDLSQVTVDADGYINCGGERIFDEKYCLFPIPNDQQTLNTAIGQNKGW